MPGISEMYRMKLGEKGNVQKVILFTGLYLLLFPNGIVWLWGNIVVYVDSYFKIILGLENVGGTTWVIPVDVAVYAVGTAISDVLVKRAGPSWTMMTGVFTYISPFVLSFFTVQHSVGALVVTTGAIPGLGSGLLYGLSLFIVSSFTSKYFGILLAIITSGTISGSLLTNELMTHYINPSNESPNLTVAGRRTESYFTQHDVIDRVPSSFLVLAGFCLGTHLLSFLLIISVFSKVILKKSSNIEVDEENLTSETLSTDLEQCKETSRLVANGQCKLQRSTSSNSLQKMASSEVNSERIYEYRKRSSSFNAKYPKSSADVTEMSSSLEKMENRTDVSQMFSSNEDLSEKRGSNIVFCGQHSKSNQTNYTTLQMMKTSVFYILFLCYTSADLSYVIVQNYYKLYGQLYIKDDHFITNFNIITVVSAVILRLGFGAMVDFLGVKNTLIIFQSSLTIVAQVWYFAPMVNAWLYMIFTTVFRSLVTGLFTIFSAATLAVFGKTYFARNLSVLMSLSVGVNLFGPLLMEALLRYFGWYSLCLACSLVNFSGLCAVLIGFPII